MAASVLNSPKAIEVSVFVVRAFVQLREAIAGHKELERNLAELERKLGNHDEKIIGLMCWIVMFLAGHDVWHFAGSPDFWQLSGPPNSDLRAFGYAFYLQFFVFLGVIAAGIRSELKARRKEEAI